MTRFGVPGQNIDTLAYSDTRLAGVPAVQGPRRPTVNDKKFPLWCEWRVNKNAVAPTTEGEFWKLIRFEANGDATWIRFYSSGLTAGVLDLRDQVGTDVTVDPITSKIDIDAAIVANAANPSTIPLETVADPTTHTLDLQLQLSTVAASPGTVNDSGISCYNTNQFTINATTGMVSLKGGGVNPPLLNLDIDDKTAPGTDPVLSSGTGTIVIGGDVVTAHSIPVETYSRDVNTFKTEVQLATTVTPATASSNDVGLVSVNENQFQINATSGMVSLKGSTTNPPALSFTLDDTNATAPDATGDVDITGSAVANATNAKPLFTARNPAADDIDVQLQVSAKITGAPGDKNDAGICSFDDTAFSVDTHGYVTLVGGAGPALDSLTGNTGGAVSPDGTGDIDITGDTVQQYLQVNGTPGSNLLELKLIEPAADGELLIGNGTSGEPDVATLTAGVGISIVNGAGSITISGNAVINEIGVSNIGLTYAAGVLTICSSDGTALSAGNPGYVTINQKTSPGLTVTITITSNQIIQDDAHASSYLANSTFGTTSGRAWADEVPFYIYAVLNDAENAISFMIHRCSGITQATAIGNMAKNGTPAISQESFFAFGNPTLGDYDANPTICIGMFTMQKSVANDWTVDALTIRDGIGKFGHNRYFIFVKGQNGASPGFFTGDAGTQPNWNSQTYVYRIIDGLIEVTYAATTCTVSGVGANTFYVYMPLYIVGGHSIYTPGQLNFYDASAGRYRSYFADAWQFNYKCFFINSCTGSLLTPAHFSKGGPYDNDLRMTLIYRCMSNS